MPSCNISLIKHLHLNVVSLGADLWTDMMIKFKWKRHTIVSSIFNIMWGTQYDDFKNIFLIMMFIWSFPFINNMATTTIWILKELYDLNPKEIIGELRTSTWLLLTKLVIDFQCLNLVYGINLTRTTCPRYLKDSSLKKSKNYTIKRYVLAIKRIYRKWCWPLQWIHLDRFCCGWMWGYE